MGDRRRYVALVAAVTIVVLAAGCSSSSSTAHNPAPFVEGQAYAPAFDVANFGNPKANPYFPLEPGVVTVFEGDGEHVEVTVTAETKVIQGVTTRVITDTVTVDGEVKEDTTDWYAADNLGNVWYFGEQTAEYENGQVTSTEGSWEAGVDGALPGVIMLADPQVGDVYRQEWYAGQAQDVAKVYAVGESVTVPNGSFEQVIITEDWSELTPDVHERKWYAPRVGVVHEKTVRGGSGSLDLVEATTQP